MQRTGGALERTCGAKGRTDVALQRSGVELQRTDGAKGRTDVALQRTWVALQRTGGAIERSRPVLTLEPAAAHTAGPLIAPKEHLHPTRMMFVRTCVRTSRWKILITPYLVVELSPGAEIWWVYVTSISDGTQILTFLGINNNRDFQKSRFICGN